MRKNKTLIPWYGGKHSMQNKLISLMPTEGIKTYVEVFGGGARVLLNKSRSEVEVYNDLHSGLASFFCCMKDRQKMYKLRERLKETPYSEQVFNYAKANWEEEIDEIEKARLTFIMITQSFNSSCETWKKPKTIDIIRTYKNRINNMIEFTYRLKDVIIENQNFEYILEKYDDEKTVFYLDPPYYPDTRTISKVYNHEMTQEQHKKMVDILLGLKGKAIVSGYDNPVYDRLDCGKWKKIKLGQYAKSSQNSKRGKRKSKAEEYVWLNYKL